MPDADSFVIDRELLAAVVECLLPGDGVAPAASTVGVVDDLVARASTDHASRWRELLSPGMQGLEAEALSQHGAGFRALTAVQQQALLAAVEQGAVSGAWPIDARRFLRTLTAVAAESYYGRPSKVWDTIGYRPAPKRDAGLSVVERVPAASTFASLRERYDVIVIGAGASGGVVACVLAEAGANVLLVDRGPVLSYAQVGRDHLRNHRFPRYGFNTPDPAPTGNPRVAVSADGRETVVPPHQAEYGTGPWVVGGGTRVYQGMAWRFLPEDFALASRYGVPEGSSLADWPLTYDDLEPYYSRAEWELGVAGDGSAHTHQGPRSKPYPMPGVPRTREAELLAAGAKKLGWSTGPVPVLINIVPRDGRGQCVQCGQCVGIACPSDAKNGTMNTLIPRAIATGRCTLVASCRALQLRTGAAGRVTGATLRNSVTGARRTIDAGHVVVAAGAVESARLLLSSRSSAHQQGLGNAHDQVGRHMQGHIYLSAFGIFDEVVQDMQGPGVSIATCDFNHGYPGAIGGGVLANEVVKMPALFWHWGLSREVPRWGAAGHQAMRELYTRTSHVLGPIQEIPNPEARVTLAHEVKDADGVPVARLSGSVHPESLKVARLHRERAAQWLRASGASQVWMESIPEVLSVGQHQAGTCRMGHDPRSSVTDAFGKVHGHDNLWVMDASLQVTTGGFNPVLNIYALAFRCAEALARR